MRNWISICMHLGHQSYREICSWSLRELMVNALEVTEFVRWFKGSDDILD